MSPDLTALDAEWAACLDELEASAVPSAPSGSTGAARGTTPPEPAPGASASVPAPASASASPEVGRWAPPVGLGALPDGLVARATGVLAMQKDALRRLEAERRDVLGQLGALRAVDGTTEPERPVYLDATA